jgi:hypothetical protein
MTNAAVPSSGRRDERDANRRKPEGDLWERRHIRVTYWLEQTLRDEVREAAKAKAKAMSISQFVAQALRRAVDEVR